MLADVSYPRRVFSAVTIPMLFSTSCRQRSALAVIPATQRSCRVLKARASLRIPVKSVKAMMGSITFSSSCPASAARVMVTSLPMMSKAT